MKPHGVIQACHLHGGKKTFAVRQQGGIEERHVGDIGQQDLTLPDIIGHGAGGPKPDIVEWRSRRAVARPIEDHGPRLEGTWAQNPFADGFRKFLRAQSEYGSGILEFLWRRYLGHLELMIESRL